MTKKHQQSSGPSYSLLALLKRTLFLHEISNTDELVEEVHEYMLKDQTYGQIKERYVGPILRSNPSFREIEEKTGTWKLTEGNKVNDSVYDVLFKHHMPLSERQILNRLAKEEHLGRINIALDLKNDARFSDLEGGKYWILSEWVVVNDYARSVLLKVKSGLTEKELLHRVVGEYKIEPDSAVFLPMLDDRFVKKEKKWTLRQFAEQKTKLRASRIERLYQYLLKADMPLSSNDLTVGALNMPASGTDVHEKLTTDPRFVFEDDKWDLRARAEQRRVLLAEQEERLESQAGLAIEGQEESLLEVGEQPTAAIEQALQEEPAPEAETPAPEEPAALEEQEAVEEEIPEQEPEISEEEPLPSPEVALVDEAPAEESGAEAEETALSAEQPALPEEEAVEEEPAEPVDEYAERLRNKVVEFLQDAFHKEGIVYNVDIIDQLVTSERKEALFGEFVQDHFVNALKGRTITEKQLIQFMVYLAEPTLNDKILDPCCGTGGFLLQILETLDAYLQEAEWTERDFSIQYELSTGQFYFVKINDEEQEYFEFPLDDAVVRWLPIIRFCQQRQLTGVDADAFAYRTADLNVAIQGFPEIVFHQDNALTSKYIGSGMYDIVLGNPPSGDDLPTRFLRRSLLLAKPGGKILLLLPDEMFTDSRLVSAALRNQIVAQTIVKAVIRFPESDDPAAYGPRHTLLYCLRKHHDAEQESKVFVGEVSDLNALDSVLEVLEDPYAPVTLQDTPIAGGVINYILSSYQGSAYNLFVEGLRRQAVHGEVLDIHEWSQVKKDSESQN